MIRSVWRIAARPRTGLRNFAEFVNTVDSHDKSKAAIVDARGSVTYGELMAKSKSLAAELAKSSQGEQPRFAIFTPRDRDYLISKLAVWAVNGISVPLNDGSPSADLSYFVETTSANAILAEGTGKHRETAEELAKITKSPLKWVGSVAKSSNPAFIVDDRDDEKGALMVFTSGTTSRPKGCITSRRAMKAQIHALVSAWEFSKDDNLYLTLPLHHVHGILALLSTISVGGRVEMAPKFDPHSMWEALARPKDAPNAITVVSAVPTIYAKLIQHYDAQPADVQRRWTETLKTNSACRLMVSGSAALPESVAKRWRELTGHTLLERMGSTECGLCLSNPYRGERKLNTVGIPLPGYEARLVDLDANGAVIEGPNKSGELQFKGAGLFSGYWKKPDATAEVLVKDEKGGLWYKTGDSAHRDEDGYYRIDGRLSADIIKSSGFKLSALEIERHLLEDKALAEVAVFGIPDDVVGEKVVAVAVAAEGRLPGSNTATDTNRLDLIKTPEAAKLAAEVRTEAKKHMAAYKVPAVIAFVPSIPRNAMGKVNKKELRKLYLEACSAGK
jgi:malonyl-CoA/methylmalonyl-CoA synthetase